MKVGPIEFAHALPRMAWRYRIMDAVSTLGDKPATLDFAAVCCTVIGLCWSGAAGPGIRFEEHGRDPIRYGEAVLEWLIGRGVQIKDVFAPAKALIEEIAASLPQEEAVQAAADPSLVAKGTSTPSSSPSGSNGSETPTTATG